MNDKKQSGIIKIKDRLLPWISDQLHNFLHFAISARWIIIAIPVLFGCFGSVFFCGFGVDSEGNLYIGRKHQIEVHRNNIAIEHLPIPVQKGWCMGLTADDHIQITTGSRVYTLQLDGTVLGNESDYNSQVDNRYHNQRIITGNDGKQYRLRYKWIWPTIEREGVVIYRTPLVDPLLKVLLILCATVVLPGLWYEILNDVKKRPSL